MTGSQFYNSISLARETDAHYADACLTPWGSAFEVHAKARTQCRTCSADSSLSINTPYVQWGDATEGRFSHGRIATSARAAIGGCSTTTGELPELIPAGP